MQLNKRTLLVLTIAFALLAASFPVAVLQSQSDSIVLSLVVPDYMKDAFSDKMTSDFESANPGVSIHLVTNVGASSTTAAQDVDKHLQELGKFASSGDVLMVSSRDVSPAAVSAGYYLDLTPLVNSDKDLNPDDFQPAVWQSFQWDKGIWALPATADLSFVTYDPTSFDKAGLPYPSDAWTPDEFVNDIRKLTVKDASGNITTPGLAGLFAGYNDGMLIRSISGDTLYDDSTLPTTPKFDKPAIESVLKTWTDLEAEGLLTPRKSRGQLPMLISDEFSLTYQPAASSDESAKRVGVLFPGGKAGLDIDGFAVSGGTQHPEQAYALARFLTMQVDYMNQRGRMPARKSLANASSVLPKLASEDAAFVDKAYTSAIPTSELRYMDYFAAAAQQIKDDHVSPQVALQTQESKALTDQQTAVAMKAGNKLFVAAPVPTPVLKPGEVALKFGLGDFASPLPTQDQWNRVIKEFTDTDPQVRQLVMESDFDFNDLKANAPKYDCFYAPFNVLTTQNISAVLSLDPFLEADQSFSKDDMLGTTLSQVTIDNKIWGLPIVITPTILTYNADLFNQAGVPAPDNDWTIDKFKDTLTALKTDPKAEPPFELVNAANSFLILIAAYGGVPLDYRTNPPTINYTDPATVTAIRQVLDLAKQGYIKYPDPSTGSYDPFATPHALYDGSLDDFTFSGGQYSQQPVYKPVTFPHGTQFSGISYSVGFAAISANTPNPDACYRWISTIAKHPELFDQMPARHSEITDPAFRATQKKELVDMFDAVDAQLKDPNTLIFPDQMSPAGQTNYLLQRWLSEAFDNYLFHDADLASGLKDAENYSKAFQACTVSLPPYDPSPDQSNAYYTAFKACAIKIDPRLKDFFTPKG